MMKSRPLHGHNVIVSAVEMKVSTLRYFICLDTFK
jgi:hypothetical protein